MLKVGSRLSGGFGWLSCLPQICKRPVYHKSSVHTNRNTDRHWQMQMHTLTHQRSDIEMQTSTICTHTHDHHSARSNSCFPERKSHTFSKSRSKACCFYLQPFSTKITLNTSYPTQAFTLLWLPGLSLDDSGDTHVWETVGNTDPVKTWKHNTCNILRVLGDYAVHRWTLSHPCCSVNAVFSKLESMNTFGNCVR